MRKCPFCGKENFELEYFCEYCDSFMGSKYPAGPPPEASEKAKALMQKAPSAKRIKRKSQKTPEYVQLYHGPKVKKSTYLWLQKKDRDAGIFILGWIILIVLCSLINR